MKAVVRKQSSKATAGKSGARVAPLAMKAGRGAGMVERRQAGRRVSPSMPARHVRKQLAARVAVAKLRYGGGAK